MLTRHHARWLVLAGGLGLAASPFLVWVRVTLLGDLTLFNLTSEADRSLVLPWGAVAIGLALAALAAVGTEAIYVRVTAVILGLIAGFYAGVLLVSLSREVEGSFGLAALGLGPLVAAASAGAVVVGGVLVDDGPRGAAASASSPGSPTSRPTIEGEPSTPIVESSAPSRGAPGFGERPAEVPHSTTPTWSGRMRIGRLTFGAALIGILVAVGVTGYMLGLRSGEASMQTFCGIGYCVRVPSDWRYRDAGTPGQATFVYFNPNKDEERLTIYAPDCVGRECLPEDADLPAPTIDIPEYAANVRRDSAYDARFETFDGDFTRWRVVYPHDSHGMALSLSPYALGVEVPDGKRHLTNEILDSFTLDDE